VRQDHPQPGGLQDVGRLDEKMQEQVIMEHWRLQKQKGNVSRIREGLRSRFRWRDRESD